MPSTPRWLVYGAVMLVTCSGCAEQEGAANTDPEDAITASGSRDASIILATGNASWDIANAQFSGVLAGDPATGCLWFTDDGTVVSVIWPVGSAVGFEPHRLLDDAGKTVAEVGQKVTAVGGSVPDPPTKCAMGGETFSAATVTRT